MSYNIDNLVGSLITNLPYTDSDTEITLASGARFTEGTIQVTIYNQKKTASEAFNDGEGQVVEGTVSGNTLTISDWITGKIALTSGIEWVAMLGATKALFDGKVNVSAIVNDLTTGGTAVPGSAENDKTLNTNKVAKAGDTMTGDLLFSGARSIKTTTADPLIFGTNNTNALWIDTGQRVGIGTPSPNSTLHVFGIVEHSVAGRNNWRNSISSSNANSPLPDSVLGSLIMKPTSDASLTIRNAANDQILNFNTEDGSLSITGKGRFGGDLELSGANRSVGTSTAHDLIFKVNNTERVRILADGSRINLPIKTLRGSQYHYRQRFTPNSDTSFILDVTGIQNSNRGVIEVKVAYQGRFSGTMPRCYIHKIFHCQRSGASTVGIEDVITNINNLNANSGELSVTWVDKDTSGAYIRIEKTAGSSSGIEGAGFIEISAHVDI